MTQLNYTELDTNTIPYTGNQSNRINNKMASSIPDITAAVAQALRDIALSPADQSGLSGFLTDYFGAEDTEADYGML